MSRDGVYFYHFPLSMGMVTAAYTLDENRESVKRDLAYAFAFCSPDDNFTKRIGRNKAKGRLLEKEFDKDGKAKERPYRGESTIFVGDPKQLRNVIQMELELQAFKMMPPPFIRDIKTFFKVKAENEALLEIKPVFPDGVEI